MSRDCDSCEVCFVGCLICCFITGGIILGTVGGIELGPRVTWNRNSETIFANVIGYDIYKDAKNCKHFDDNFEKCIKVEGWVIVDFPKDTYSKFKFCDLDYYYNQTMDECEEYLSLKYPIGDSIKVYYDPKNLSDTRVEKFKIGWAIFGTVVGILITMIPLTIVCLLIVGAIIDRYTRYSRYKAEKHYKREEILASFVTPQGYTKKPTDSVTNKA